MYLMQILGSNTNHFLCIYNVNEIKIEVNTLRVCLVFKRHYEWFHNRLTQNFIKKHGLIFYFNKTYTNKKLSALSSLIKFLFFSSIKFWIWAPKVPRTLIPIYFPIFFILIYLWGGNIKEWLLRVSHKSITICIWQIIEYIS